MPINSGETKIYNPYNVYLNQVANEHIKYRIFHDKLRNLPINLQDFIFDVTPGDFIKDGVSIPLNLNEGQSKETAKIVLEIILADVYLGNVVQEIKNRLNVDEQKAKTVAGLIVARLFAPILEDLKKMHIQKFAKNIPKPNSQIDDRTINLKNQ